MLNLFSISPRYVKIFYVYRVNTRYKASHQIVKSITSNICDKKKLRSIKIPFFFHTHRKKVFLCLKKKHLRYILKISSKTVGTDFLVRWRWILVIFLIFCVVRPIIGLDCLVWRCLQQSPPGSYHLTRRSIILLLPQLGAGTVYRIGRI